MGRAAMGRAAMRATTGPAVPSRARLAHEDASAFTAAVVNRLIAERDASCLARLSRMFEDMRLVYASAAGALAVIVCALVTLATMQFAMDERPDALALTTLLATSGATSPVPVDDEVRTRWTARVRQAHEAATEDAVFALAAVVTRHGRVLTLRHARATRHVSAADRKLIEGLLDVLARARFASEPDERSLPVSTVWLITSTTVHATKKPTV
jgi:hypothetical protein